MPPKRKKQNPSKARRSGSPRRRGRGRAAATPSTASTKPAETQQAPPGAEALVAQLRALGVEVVFGIPGVHNLTIFHALRAAGIRVVVVRHEQTAAAAADGYARSTGRLGVCVTTTGPGAANTAAALGEARAARSPVLHISTQSESRILLGKTGRFSLHESPRQRELMESVCVWAGSVAQAEAIPTMVLRAAREAMGGRRGPAFVEIPFDLLEQPVRWAAREQLAPVVRRPDERSLERAAEVIDAAKRPIIWAGGGVHSADAAAGVQALSEHLRAPVVTSFNGKGALPPEHPLLVGLPPHEPAVTKLISTSDAAIIIGSDLDAMNTQGWRLPFPRPRVSINAMAVDARSNYAADVVMEVDAARALDELLPRLRPAGRRNGEPRVAKARDAAAEAAKADKEVSRALRFLDRVRGAVPEEAFVLADMCVAGYWATGYWRPPGPRSFATAGWGTLGFALPAAVGAAAAGRPTFVIAGDAGLLFGVGELATLVQEKLPVVILVVNDDGYGMLRFDEEQRFERSVASDLVAPDFVALADSFGVPAERVTLRDLRAGLTRAFERGGPGLVELRARFTPPPTTSPRWPLRGKPEARP